MMPARAAGIKNARGRAGGARRLPLNHPPNPLITAMV